MNFDRLILAKTLAELGMSPVLISDLFPGTSSIASEYHNAKKCYSRKRSLGWTKSSDGFQAANVMIQIYRRIAKYPNFNHAIDMDEIVTAWELINIQHPEFFESHLVDIGRFYYLIQAVCSDEFLASTCQCSKCNNVFFHHPADNRCRCWPCVGTSSIPTLKVKKVVIDDDVSPMEINVVPTPAQLASSSMF
jgi:hypothetical protein